MDNFETAKQHFIGGLQFLEKNDFHAAETEFARSLELVPNRVSTLNNLSAIKVKLKQFAEAKKFAIKAIAVDDKSPEAWSNLAIALIGSERHEEVLLACDRALACDPTFTKARVAKASTLLQLKRLDDALQACDDALKKAPDNYDALYAKSQVLKELKRVDEAQKVYAQSFQARAALSPVYIAERRATQKASGLILSQNPTFDEHLLSFEELLMFCQNYPGQFANHISNDIHFTYAFVGEAARESSRKQIPQPDFVLNNHANGEALVAAGNLLALSELVDGFNVPVVNHPKKAVQTIRDTQAKLLENIPDLVVPKTLRFSSTGKTPEELMKDIEAQFEYPFFTRSLINQMGYGATRVDSRETLAQALASAVEETFFVTQIVDSRGNHEFHRKIRAAVVQDQIIIVRVDRSPNWIVSGRSVNSKRADFYLERPHILEEEKRICADPEATLGRPALKALKTIRERVPLEIFGIDFDVAADGRVVFYEANATMNLFSTADKRVPNPKEAEDSLKQAFVRYFASLPIRG